jgi:hypothetical protein
MTKDQVAELIEQIPDFLTPDEFLVALATKAAEVEREAMVIEAAKQGWAMKNEDPFEDAVREIAAIRARGEK